MTKGRPDMNDVPIPASSLVFPPVSHVAKRAEFLPLHQLIRHEDGRVIRYAVNAATAGMGAPVQQPLGADGLAFTIHGQSGVHSLALELDSRGLADPCRLTLTISSFEPSGDGIAEQVLHTTRLTIPPSKGNGAALFDLIGAPLREKRLYRVTLRPDGNAPQGGFGVWGCITAAACPEPSIEVTPAVRREPMWRLQWREHGARMQVTTEEWLEKRFGLIPLPVYSHSSLEFCFEAPAAGIDALGIRVAPRMARGTVPLQLELHDRDGNLLLMRSIRPMPRPVAQYVDFDLAGIPLQVGETYRVSLTSPTAAADDCNCVLVNREGLPARPPAPVLGLLGAETGLSQYVERSRDARGMTPHGQGHLRVCALLPDGHPRPGSVAAFLGRAFPDHTIDLQTLSDGGWAGLLPRLSTQDVVLFVDLHPQAGEPTRLYDETVALLDAGLVCTVHVDTGHLGTGGQPAAGLQLDGGLQRALTAPLQTARRCRHALVAGPDGRAAWADGRPEPVPDLRSLRDTALGAALPHIVVVCDLRGDGDAFETVLHTVTGQSYGGPVTLLLLSDPASSEDFGIQAQLWSRRGRQTRLDIRVVSQAVAQAKDDTGPAGIGGSQGRRLLQAAALTNADVCVVLDAGLHVNRDFLAAHAFAHRHPDFDVVIGAPPVMADGRTPARLLDELQADANHARDRIRMQDPMQPDGFLNVAAGNLSVKAALLRRLALPQEDGASRHAAQGSGTEAGGRFDDLVLGYLLYRAGARFGRTEHAFAVRTAKAAGATEEVPADGLTPHERRMEGFNSLFRPYPELALVARRWAVAEAGGILEAIHADDRLGECLHTPAYAELKSRFGAAVASPALRRAARRPLRVLSYRWHCGHQYELYKLPHEFTLVRGLGPGLTDRWDYEQRPLRPNVRFIDMEELDPSKYDVAILHFDENILAPQLGAGALPDDWGNAFRWFLANVPLPKIALCHGTPAFAGQYGRARGPIDRFQIHETERQALVDLLAERGIPVVVNAWQAKAEWGFADSRVIWHGFDPQEYPAARYERDVLALGSSMWERPHYRGAYEHERVMARLPADIRVETAANQDGGLWPRQTNDYARSKFRSYIDRIRSFTAYLDTTRRSPMPRSRAEAMLCGVVPVCLRSDDVGLFIRHGVNGFCGESPEELADYLVHLCRNRDAARRIGERARLTALDLFNHDRYLAAWTALLDETLERSKPVRPAASAGMAARKAGEAPVPAPVESPAASSAREKAAEAEEAPRGIPAAVPQTAASAPASAPAPVSAPPPPAPTTAPAALSAAAPQARGGVDWMVQNQISGWAFDSGRPDEVQRVVVLVDGRPRYRLAANLERPKGGAGEPRHCGFRLTLPSELCDGKPHRIDLAIADSGVLLNAKPLRFQQPDPAGHCIGQMDGVNGRTISGWCCNTARAARPVDLAVLVDGEVRGMVTADRLRSGLKLVGIGSERHGFSWPIPDGLCDGKPHRIAFVVAATGQQVPGSPLTIQPDARPSWRGHVTFAADGDIVGWAYDERTPDVPVLVDILVDGRPYRTLTADVDRPDLEAINAARLASGFRCRPPSPPPGTESAVAEIRVRIAGTGQDLPGSPMQVDLCRTYCAWVERYDTLTPSGREALRARLDALPRRPLLSVLMPVYNTPETLLREAIASVRRQIYPDWELCIADDASTDPKVAAVLAEESRADRRIRVVRRPVNGHISAASNSALELAAGEFAVLLDHDDLLREHALLLVAEEILANPEATLIFSDEDKIDEAGERFEPYFKGGYNPDLLAAQNCISHLGVYRIDLMRRLGGFTVGLEGSQDYDLALRVIEHSPPAAVRHIPHVLYHWRAVPGSTALRIDEKDYAADAMRKGLEASLKRRGLEARACPSLQPPFLHLRPRLKAWPKVSVILSCHGDAARLADTLDFLRRFTARSVAEVIVTCPTAASADLAKVAKGWRNLRLLPMDKAPASLRNAAARAATGEVLVFLDEDTRPMHRIWLAELVRQCMAPRVGAAGARLVTANGLIRYAGYRLGGKAHGTAAYAGQHVAMAGPGGRAVLRQTVSSVSVTCMAIRRDRFMAAGSFDESLPQALHDIDLCLRLSGLGFRSLYTPLAQMVCRDAAPPVPTAEIQALRARWGDALDADPYYNPNLTLETTDAGLAFPPRRSPFRSLQDEPLPDVDSPCLV
ncbi:glycosyltransferase involved in cell wall biosynthesis [Azospirillum lipoferum]|uniref:Glycosyltransferase n=1 Tax=Azospirillum lipoferum TaxID=193 RepID=A0A5A9GH82_AZOLI|nr:MULTISPECIES: glycosyltransferase [Azospirillum]KAA0593696.1 glycosyltransferase [Azospirillum lipoferum]MCP1615043.1 glycosyltransferase involved in cell wall biosynthesis [Azospirillum lipoferum]MDW5536948.1 glycosyltransferase [Azospirillum sp. NL1]